MDIKELLTGFAIGLGFAAFFFKKPNWGELVNGLMSQRDSLLIRYNDRGRVIARLERKLSKQGKVIHAHRNNKKENVPSS